MKLQSKKPVPPRTVWMLVSILMIWAGVRISLDYREAGGWERNNLIAVGMSVCLGLLMIIGVSWYKNRPL